MQKAQLIELVRSNLSGGNTVPDGMGKFHPADIERMIEVAYADLLFNVYLQAKRHSDFAQLDHYTIPYTVSVSYNDDREKYYAELPVSLVGLPDGKGIRQMSTVKDEVTSFLPRQSSSNPVMEELEVGYTQTQIRFWVEGSKVWFDDNMTTDIADYGVLMKVVQNFNEYSEDDEVYLPAGQRTQLIALVRQFLEGRRVFQEDKVNDDNSKQI